MNRILISVFVGVILVTSCEEQINKLEPSLDCEKFKSGLLNYNSDTIRKAMGEITSDLTPDTTANDPFGHKENFDILIARLNECQGVTAELFCYGCIETFPVQSELLLTIDSSGVEVYRVLDIITPERNVLTLREVHPYHSPLLKLTNTRYKGCFRDNPMEKHGAGEAMQDAVFFEKQDDTLTLQVALFYNCCGQLTDSLITGRQKVDIFISDTCKGDHCVCRCNCDFGFEYQFTGVSQNDINFGVYLKELNDTAFNLWREFVYQTDLDY